MLMARSRSAALSSDRTDQPISLNEPPKPSQICAADMSSTVTSAFVPVTSVSAPSVFQYAPGADVTRETASSAPHGLVSDTHAPLQSSIPGAQRHAPTWHVCSAAHGRPHPPQFAASFATSTHW